MIEFEILKSPDEDAVGLWKFYFNNIIIGRRSPFMTIEDDEIEKNHFELAFDGELLKLTLKEGKQYVLNGKLASHVHVVKKDSIINIGNTEIQIIDFSDNPKSDKDVLLENNLEKIVRGNHHSLKLIEIIQKGIARL